MKDYDVLCIGELNVDLIITGLKQMPKVDTEIIAEKSLLTLGSSTAIFGCGVSRLGLNTSFIGIVGNDDFGKTVIENLDKNKVDISNILVYDTIETGITIALGYNNDRALVTALGSIDKLKVDDIDFSLVDKAKHIHVGSFFLQSGLREKLVELFKYARENNITTSLDSGWDDTGNWDYGIFEVLKYTSIFFPNEVEAMSIAKTGSVDEAITILSRYAETVVVKTGSKGCVVAQNKCVNDYEAYTVDNVVDTTGAGDSFNAGFIYGYVNNQPIDKCVKYGLASGAICVQNIGGASSCPTKDELESFLKEK